MRKRNEGYRYGIFRNDPEYYTFISGALISIPLSLLFEVAENYREPAFYFALVFSLATSFFCFNLAVVLKEVDEVYGSKKRAIGNTPAAWNGAIDDKKGACIRNLVLTIVTLVIAVACVVLVKFVDSSVSQVVNDAATQAVTTIQ